MDRPSAHASQQTDAAEKQGRRKAASITSPAQEAGGRLSPFGPLSLRSIVALQGLQGNAVVSRTLSRPYARAPIQRCGGEVHEGCSCADDAARHQDDDHEPSAPVAQRSLSRTIQRFTDGTPEAPSPDLPDGSPYASLPAPLLDMLRRTLAAKSFWRWANGKPTNLGKALDLLGPADINTLVQLQKRLSGAGLWGFIGTMKTVWSTSSLGINFDETGSIQGGIAKDKFCKDSSIGQSYHSGKQCWREMVDPGTPGLHVCLPGEVHIDPHQTVSGSARGIQFGGGSWISFPSLCFYDLLSLAGHMMDVEGGRAVNVFTRRDHAYQTIDKLRKRIEPLKARNPSLTSQLASLDALSGRLDTQSAIMRGWAIRGFEGDDGSAEAKAVVAEIVAVEEAFKPIEAALVEPERTESGLPPPGAHQGSS